MSGLLMFLSTAGAMEAQSKFHQLSQTLNNLENAATLHEAQLSNSELLTDGEINKANIEASAYVGGDIVKATSKMADYYK